MAYTQSAGGKAVIQEYNVSKARKISKKKYSASTRGKATVKKWLASANGQRSRQQTNERRRLQYREAKLKKMGQNAASTDDKRGKQAALPSGEASD